MPDPIFDNLYRDTEGLAWAPADQVRHRGRQRSRRAAAGAVLASAVAVVVVATGVVALAGRPNVAPPPIGTEPATPSPSTSPTPTPTPADPEKPSGSPSAGSSGWDRRDPPTSPAIPSSATLRIADVPTGYEPHEVRAGQGDWTLAFAASTCPQPWTAFQLEVSAERYAGFLRPLDERILQQVNRHPAGDAARFMDRVRAGVDSCGERFSVIDSGFAGEESMSLLSTVEGSVSHYVVVRQADLVSLVWHKGETDRATARALGVRAADRLCAGTDTC